MLDRPPFKYVDCLTGSPVAVAQLQEAEAVLQAAHLQLPQARHLHAALRRVPQRQVPRAHRLQQVLRRGMNQGLGLDDKDFGRRAVGIGGP